jgi:hypothetical protein
VCFHITVGGFAGGGAEKTPAGDYSINTIRAGSIIWALPVDLVAESHPVCTSSSLAHLHLSVILTVLNHSSPRPDCHLYRISLFKDSFEYDNESDAD